MGTGRGPRVRAPRLQGRRWLNSTGLSPADLRGSVVLLDFWTSSCVNCLHVLAELRPLQERFADVLVTVGVHSPKFPHEADPPALDAAVDRLGVHHPVLDDADLLTWGAYAARAWPTLVVVDPEGYVVSSVSGEGHAAELELLVADLVAEHDRRGTLRRSGSTAPPPPPGRTGLRFPARALPLTGGTVLVADAGHHRLVELEADLSTHRRHLGTGEPGLVDGRAARFAGPQGLALLPGDVAARVGYDVVVADTQNHALRGVRLADGDVRTVAGTGRPLRRREGGGPALGQDLSSPWDVAWFDGQLVVAMAGVHQLWAFDPEPGLVRVLAGTTAEGLRDGPAESAWCAQPSGLAAGAGGRVLWFVDAETSALRSLRRSGSGAGEPDRGVPVVTDHRFANVDPVARPGYVVRTHVGAGLFEFGSLDGPAARARFQHPLGVAVAPDGTVLVADTFNGAVRRYDPVADAVTTVLTDLAEPVDVLPDGAGLTTVDSAAHRLVRDLAPGGERRARVPRADLRPGEVALEVVFAPPPGRHLDDRAGGGTHLDVTATPPDLLSAGTGAGPGLSRPVVLTGEGTGGVTGGVLHVSARAASCDVAAGAGAACHLHRARWDVPVRVVAGGDDRLVLTLPAD
ncbi:thioredoxin-like domain-containing protein [Kineococcus sp. LSe6-4]|uniref:Thioredoxin-like domain-containing protein n=1 Tax=Kineococcus halophytocola TaxID=3234027 RepID=A0ABV4H077_9ACTN